MADTQTPYEKYAHFCRTVVGIEPKSEEDWERYGNRTMTKLPMGASTKQLADLIHDNRARRYCKPTAEQRR
jgi:hypothetical protein